MSWNQNSFRAYIQHHFQKIMTVQTKNRTTIWVNISDFFQTLCHGICCLQTGKQDYIVYFSGLSIFLINRTDFPGDNKTCSFSRELPAFFFYICISEAIQAVSLWNKSLLQFFSPYRMREITCSNQWNSFLSRPEIQIFRRALFACRHGKPGMNVQISYCFHSNFLLIF